MKRKAELAMRTFTLGGDPEVGRIVTGHFDARPGYRVVRPDGTTSWLITLTNAGEGHIGERRTYPGEVVLIRPQTPHDYGVPKGSERWDFLWAHFRPPAHWAAWLGGESVRTVIADARVQARFTEIYRFSFEEKGEDLALNALEEVIIRTAEADPHPILDGRIRVVTERVRGDLRYPWGVEELARIVGLSPSRLSHLFRAETGEPLGRYIERQRLARAQRLLEASALSITQIAEVCGFPNVYYFSLRFKHTMGEPPTAYRERVIGSSAS
jgi:AraC family transcriptional regulator of arabinose operon